MPFRLDVWEIVGRDRLDRHCNDQRTEEENERARWLQTQSFPPSPPASVPLVPRASREYKRVHNRCSKIPTRKVEPSARSAGVAAAHQARVLAAPEGEPGREPPRVLATEPVPVIEHAEPPALGAPGPQPHRRGRGLVLLRGKLLEGVGDGLALGLRRVPVDRHELEAAWAIRDVVDHSGMFPCLRWGIVSRFDLSISRLWISLTLVSCGSMTSST